MTDEEEKALDDLAMGKYMKHLIETGIGTREASHPLNVMYRRYLQNHNLSEDMLIEDGNTH